MENFKLLVDKEKQSTREKYSNIVSMHEGYGVLAEELHEYFLETIKKPSERDPENVLKELAQLASTAEIIAEDLGLAVETETSSQDSYKEAYLGLVSLVYNLIENMTLIKNIPIQKVSPLEERSDYYKVMIKKDILDEVKKDIASHVFSS